MAFGFRVAFRIGTQPIYFFVLPFLLSGEAIVADLRGQPVNTLW